MRKVAKGSGNDSNSAGETTKQRLLDSAAHEFAEKGLAGARVGEIVGRAGTNKQSVYHHFGSKEHLYYAVLEHAFMNARKHDTDLAVDLSDPPAALQKFVEHMQRTSLADPRYQRLLLDANWYGGRHLDAINPDILPMGRRLTILTRIYLKGVSDGCFRPGLDVKELYISLLGILSIRHTNAFSLSRTVGVDLTSPEGLAKSSASALDHIWAGILKR